MQDNIKKTKRSSPPLISNILILFLISMILANLAGNMYGGLLPLYLKELNASVTQIGLFFTLSQIVPLILQILGGWISDNLGRLKSIAIGSVAGIIGYAVMIVSPTWRWVLLSEGINAVTRSLIGPSFGAFIAEQSEAHNRAKVFGFTQSIYSIVVVLGPPIGGWLAQRYGFRVMLMVAACIYIFATLIRVYMAKHIDSGVKADRTALSFQSLKKNIGLMIGLIAAGGLIMWMIITDGVRDIAFTISFNLIPVFLQDIAGISLIQIGTMESAYGITTMLINYPAGWLSDKKGERVNLVIAYLFFFAGLLVFIKTHTFTGYILSWVLLGMGDGMAGPAYQSLISKAVPDKLRGTAFGIMSSSLGLFSLPAPAIGGKMYEKFGPLVPFRITMWASLLAIIPIWLKFRQTPREKALIADMEESMAESVEESITENDRFPV